MEMEYDMDLHKLLVFIIGSQKYAMAVDWVVNVARMVEMIEVPETTDSIMGAINYHGDVIPVIDVGYCIKSKSSPVNLTNRLIIIEQEKHKIALMVEAVVEVVDYSASSVKPLENESEKPRKIIGIVKADEEMLLLFDLAEFFRVSRAFHYEGSVSEHG